MSEWTYQRYKKTDFRKVPKAPGIYKYLNSEGTIIYVGKAKNLRNRVSNYFISGNQHSLKTAKLVREIEEIEFVIVNNEYEALVLENTLIKEYQPKYNIMLKDGKSYPYILITNERFPRVLSTRRVNQSEGEYFGPFTSGRSMHNILSLIKKLYQIRNCTLNLSEKNIQANKYKVCLEYHVGNCLGPCQGFQDESNYNDDIAHIRNILRGNLIPVKSNFKQAMEKHSVQLNFETAQIYKEKIDSLDSYQSKSLVANPKITQTDIFTIVSDSTKSYINYMKIDDGMIKLSETIEVIRKLEEGESEILPLIMFNFRRKFNSNSNVILSNILVDPWEKVVLQMPEKGDKRKLIELSLKNVEFYKKENTESQPTPNNKILELLKKDLKLSSTPNIIECFDNSNIQGSNPVASMVYFKNGKPSKKDYRKFNIKTVIGPDDFLSMKEIVSRRYKRVLDENLNLPDLILIDGGKGQLAAACDALKELNLYGRIPIIGIAKRLEELYYPNDPYPIHIQKKSPSLRLLQRIRDEAHRFAITFHRDKRSKEQVRSSLEEIQGIGEKTIKVLLNQFKSTERIKHASVTELAQFVGLSKAQIIIKTLNKKEDQK